MLVDLVGSQIEHAVLMFCLMLSARHNGATAAAATAAGALGSMVALLCCRKGGCLRRLLKLDGGLTGGGLWSRYHHIGHEYHVVAP